MGTSFTYLNQIRNRAVVTPFTSTGLTNQTEFRKAVLDERRLELPLTVFLDYENPLWTSESMLYSSGDMIFLPNLYVCLIVFHIFKVYFEV